MRFDYVESEYGSPFKSHGECPRAICSPAGAYFAPTAEVRPAAECRDCKVACRECKVAGMGVGMEAGTAGNTAGYTVVGTDHMENMVAGPG